jgi:uncharacterized protein YkwD
VVYNDGYESQVMDLINNERAGGGLSALSYNGSLGSRARAWSTFMATNNVFYHSGDPVWEIIAAGYGTPADAVAGWMASPGHHDIIMEPSLTQFGAGYAYCSTSSYGSYWTVQFTP